MVRVRRTTVVDAPVDAVWRILRDFNGHDRWHPLVERSDLEGGRRTDELGAIRNFTGSNRLPKSHKREIDPPLLRRETVEMALQVCGVFVNQIEKIVHEFAKREVRPEAGHDCQQPRAAAGEDPQRLHHLRRAALAGHRLPKSRAFVLPEWAQRKHPEQVVQRLVWLVYLLEPTRRACQKENPGLSLERMTQLPPHILVSDV